jgi:hypothetical protein
MGIAVVVATTVMFIRGITNTKSFGAAFSFATKA